jgi:hypothetical protein
LGRSRPESDCRNTDERERGGGGGGEGEVIFN